MQLNESQLAAIIEAQQLAARAYTLVIEARLPVSTNSMQMVSGLSAARDILSDMVQSAKRR